MKSALSKRRLRQELFKKCLMKNISNLRMEVASQMSNSDENEKHEPASWEIIMFRLLNAVMVIFFLTATVKLQGFVSLINQSYVSCVRR